MLWGIGVGGTVIVADIVVIVVVIRRLAWRTRVEDLHRSIAERIGIVIDVGLVRLRISALRHKGRNIHDLGEACVGRVTVETPMVVAATIAS